MSNFLRPEEGYSEYLPASLQTESFYLAHEFAKIALEEATPRTNRERYTLHNDLQSRLTDAFGEEYSMQKVEVTAYAHIADIHDVPTGETRIISSSHALFEGLVIATINNKDLPVLRFFDTQPCAESEKPIVYFVEPKDLIRLSKKADACKQHPLFLQYLSMDQAEIDKTFLALTDNLERDAEGKLRESTPVDAAVKTLIDLHSARVAQHPDIDTMSDDEVRALQQELKAHIRSDLTDLIDDLRLHDEISTSGDAIALILNRETGELLWSETLTNNIKLYGTLHDLIVTPTPTASEINSIFTDIAPLLENKPMDVDKFGLAFEMRNVSLATTDEHGVSTPGSISNIRRTLLLIDSPGLKLRKLR